MEDQYEYLYDAAIDLLLTVPVTEEWVDTRDGQTHVLTAGDASAPPVFIFQGGNVTNPVTLAWFEELADDFYLIAPDTPGEPGKSSSDSIHEYGPWIVDVLDGLGINQAPMVGASHGAGVVLEGAAYAPDRIEVAALVVPAGFGTPLSLNLARIIVPALVYRFMPRRQLLTRALAPMFTQPVSDIDWVIVETIGTALRTSDLSAEFPGPDSAETLASCRAPMLVRRPVLSR
jgi:pimeloyl-ACP methyl ester carboxylesterase